MSETLKKTPCPKCGELTLVLDLRLKAKEIGEFSLAGQQMKFSVQELPHLSCANPVMCDFEEWGRIEGTHAVFKGR